MAFFQSRKGGDDSATARQPESIEAIRRRARHRLIGASVLVLIGVVGFPLLFDTQPRPVSVDIPIEIPDRSKATPLNVPAAPATQSAPAAQPSASGVVTQAAAPVAAPAPAPAPAPAGPDAAAAVAAKAEAAAVPKPAATPVDDGAKAQALLEGKPVASTPVVSEGRFVVQVGAFSDVAKARETRLKLEHAGLKTYTQVVETKDGKRIRVRLGPFASKADAERAAEKAKALDLQSNVLTL